MGHCRANAGASGVDNETFERIDTHGLERWLETLWEELSSGKYVPTPLLRVWIPKSNGGQRPLGNPCISDRVVQMAAVLVIGPIFEVDLLPQQHGFRPGLDAKMALRRVYFHVTQHGRREVVDADLRDYLDTASYCPPVHEVRSKSSGSRAIALIRSPFCLPRITWTASSSPRLTRCNTVWRETPSGLHCLAHGDEAFTSVVIEPGHDVVGQPDAPRGTGGQLLARDDPGVEASDGGSRGRSRALPPPS